MKAKRFNFLLQCYGMEDEVIAEYLRSHPEFFRLYPEFIAHSDKDGESLTLQQLKRQRQQLDIQKAELDWLHQNARDNQSIGEKIHAFNVALLQSVYRQTQSKERADVLFLEQMLCDFFGISAAKIMPFSPLPALFDSRFAEVEKYFQSLGARYQMDNSSQAPLVLLPWLTPAFQSFALLPVMALQTKNQLLAVVLLGSNDKNMYSADQGTNFLEQLSNTLQPVLLYTDFLQRAKS